MFQANLGHRKIVIIKYQRKAAHQVVIANDFNPSTHSGKERRGREDRREWEGGREGEAADEVFLLLYLGYIL